MNKNRVLIFFLGLIFFIPGMIVSHDYLLGATNDDLSGVNSSSQDGTNIVLTNVAHDSSADFFKDKTKLKDPFQLRDPFKELKAKEEKKLDQKTGFYQNGVFTNLPTLEGVPLKAIRITGILVGPDRRAIAQIGGKGENVILREGMKIGEDKSEIKAILPGGIVLVEKIINVYGHEEYLETIIPISDSLEKK